MFDLWAHATSYLTGIVGGIVLIVLVLIRRHRRTATIPLASRRRGAD
jgi:hypothetical protein